MVDVALEKVRKTFGEVVAVDDVSLKVESGSLVTLLGPSGCGKTTCLRCISGLEELDSGKIYIGDHLVNDVQPNKRGIGMVFQTWAVWPHITFAKSKPVRIFGGPDGAIHHVAYEFLFAIPWPPGIDPTDPKSRQIDYEKEILFETERQKPPPPCNISHGRRSADYKPVTFPLSKGLSRCFDASFLPFRRSVPSQDCFLGFRFRVLFPSLLVFYH